MSEELTVSVVRERLREQLAEILYTESSEINAESTFEELGMDSVLSVELVAAINTQYGLSEKIEAMYQYPTLDALAEHVVAVVADLAAAARS